MVELARSSSASNWLVNTIFKRIVHIYPLERLGNSMVFMILSFIVSLRMRLACGAGQIRIGD